MGGGHKRQAQRRLEDFMPQKYGEAWDVVFTPESRVKDMDRLGWDKMVCIDNFPGPIRGIQEGADQALLWACARAYNNYSRSFCDTDASKLKMVAVVPDQHDAEGLITETRRAVAELGAVTVVVPRPTKGMGWHHPQYDPLLGPGRGAGLPHVLPRRPVRRAQGWRSATSLATWSPARR